MFAGLPPGIMAKHGFKVTLAKEGNVKKEKEKLMITEIYRT